MQTDRLAGRFRSCHTLLAFRTAAPCVMVLFWAPSGRVTDAVVAETARIANETQKKGSRDSVKTKREDVRIGERERDERIVAMEGEERRDDLNAWLTLCFARFC